MSTQKYSLAPSYSSISVVVPVFNSADNLENLVRELHKTLPQLGTEFEVILVNDGSQDSSWTVIQRLSERYEWLKGLNLGRNYGQHNALLAGIRSARFDVVVTLDDDLQNPPKEIPKLLQKLSDDYDVVYGKPKAERHGFWRDLASRASKLALKYAVGAAVAPDVSAFRAFRRDLRKGFEDYQCDSICIDVLLSWSTTRFCAVFVEHDSRKIGNSNYTVRKLLTHAVNMLTGYSTAPLRLASSLGLIFTGFGFLTLSYVVIRFLIQGVVVPGFAFTACVISIFSGVQLFTLGIAGEYLARMYARILQRPSYVIRESVLKAHPKGLAPFQYSPPSEPIWREV